MTIVLTRRPLSAARAYAELARGGAGGIVVFVGRVRADRDRHGTVARLYYEAHDGPAHRALAALEREARRRFGARGVVLWHRLGSLPVGTASVIVGCATGHRAEAFRASRFLIDRLKATVPIWKTKERARPGRPPRARPARRPAR